MKKLLKNSFIAAFALLSASMMAKEKDFSLSFESTASKKLTFKVANAENVSLLMFNDVDGQIYSEKIVNEDRVVKAYDLNQLSVGTYYLVAESAQLMRRYKIEVNEQGVVVNETPDSEIVKPEYVVNGNIVDMKMPASEAVNILVEDQEDNEYYNEKVTPKDGMVSLRFDLNPLTADSYVIHISNGKNTFSKVISLR